MYERKVTIKELPDGIQKALKRLGYGRRDITVRAATTYHTGGGADDGSRAVLAIIQIASGQSESFLGGWGGGNAFSKPGVADQETRNPTTKGTAIFNGVQSSGPLWGYLTLHPDDYTGLDGGSDAEHAELTDKEELALRSIVGLNSKGRETEFRHYGLGTYSPKNPYVIALVAKGLIKFKGNGIVELPAARNYLGQSPMLREFKRQKALPFNEKIQWLRDKFFDREHILRDDELTELRRAWKDDPTLQEIMSYITQHQTGKTAKLSMYPEGEPADPTENMSPEDAKEWHRQNDLHKDEFKDASTSKMASRVAANYTQQGDDPILLLNHLLALLRAQHMLYWTGHWQATGDSSYGDHLLMERLYTGNVVAEIDTLAEKMVAMGGAEAVDPQRQIELMHNWVQEVDDLVHPIERALFLEREFQDFVEHVYEVLSDSDDMSLGLDDFLMSMANDHETSLYLLQQRVDGFGGVTASDKTAKRRTYQEAAAELFTFLGTKGWTLSDPWLKVRHATRKDANGTIRLFFRPQAIYYHLLEGPGRLDMGKAHTLGGDFRDETPQQFLHGIDQGIKAGHIVDFDADDKRSREKWLAEGGKVAWGGRGRSYPKDPYWMTTKYPGVAWDGRTKVQVPKGTQVLYYPNTKEMLVGAAANKGWADLEDAKRVEDY